MTKKLILVAIAVLFISGLAMAAQPGSQTSPGRGDILGQGKLDSDPHKIFRLIRFVPRDNTSISTGLPVRSIVVWDVTADDGVTVTWTDNSQDSAVAGILATTVLTPEYGTLGNTASQDIGKRNWGWLQTYGPAEGLLAAGAEGFLKARGVFGPASTRGCISAFSVDGTQWTASVNPATGATKWGWAGFAMDDASSATVNTTIDVFLRGLD